MIPKPLQELIDEIASLPGIGPKSATRIAFQIANGDEKAAKRLGEALGDIHEKIELCVECFNYSETKICKICNNGFRNAGEILVVETPMDAMAFEGTDFQGKYHILWGLIAPLAGKTAEDIKIKELVARLKKLSETESKIRVVVACSTSLEGEATTNFIKNELAELAGVEVYRIARGLPSNSAAEYQDPATLINSLANMARI